MIRLDKHHLSHQLKEVKKIKTIKYKEIHWLKINQKMNNHLWKMKKVKMGMMTQQKMVMMMQLKVDKITNDRLHYSSIKLNYCY